MKEEEKCCRESQIPDEGILDLAEEGNKLLKNKNKTLCGSAKKRKSFTYKTKGGRRKGEALLIY